MRITKLLLTFFLISMSFYSNSAKASLLAEPYLGYSFGSSDHQGTEYDYNTTQIGARVGYQMLGLMAGIDYSMAMGSYDMDTKVKSSNTEGTLKADSKSQFGLFVGYELPILLRAWGTYFVNTSFEDTGANTKYSGEGFALGAGFTALPLLSLNLEYRNYSYDEQETIGQKSAVSPAWGFSEILFSVSLPLNL